MRRYGQNKRIISISVPESVLAKVRLILLDPARGRIGYGNLSALITQLLEKWLAERGKDGN